MKGNEKPYELRVQTNIGEELFESYCKEKGYAINRIGFDEGANYVENFSKLNPLLRNLPDYIVNTESETFVVCVKGTANFKKKEYELLPLMMEWFSSPKAPLVYAFCFQNVKPRLVFPEKIIELYKFSKDQKWSDGVVYRNLKIL